MTPTAYADPLPAQYSGNTSGDILSLGFNALNAANIDAAVGHSATEVESTGTPRAHAESANLGLNAVGIPADVAAGEANSDETTPTDSYQAGLGALGVPPVLQVGAINGQGSTAWAGDAECVPDGTPIAQSTTSLANANLGLDYQGAGVSLLDLGAVETSGNTQLQNGSVVSTASGSVADLSLINGLVQVQVIEAPTLTATSDGTTGSVTANDYAVAVTVGAETTVLRAGMSLPVQLNVGLLEVALNLSVGDINDTSSGATGSGSVDFLNITGDVTGPFGANLAHLDLGLLPLSAEATAPQGGVECDQLDAPAITEPAAG